MLFTWAGILGGNLVQLASLFNCISFLFSRKFTFNFVMHLVIHENWSYGSYLNFLPSFCPSVFVWLFVYYFYIILLTFIQTIFLTCFIFELGRITWISNNTTVFLGGGENSSLPIFKFGILRYSCLIAFNASSKTQGEYYRPSVGWAEMARRKFSSTRWCKSPWEHCPCLEAVVAQIRPT